MNSSVPDPSPISFSPIFESTRGETVESIHYGAFAVVDRNKKLIACHGNPQATSFLRSSAKPFQALPLIEAGGKQRWALTSQEISIMCASHAGTDEHVQVLTKLQVKIQVKETDLLCGIHMPTDDKTHDTLLQRGERPTPNRHNCSGKHTGMLAYAKMIHASTENYIDFEHPIQQKILETFSDMCDLPIQDIALGMDGCSAPVFAVPLENAAYGYARLCDPSELDPNRAAACQTITQAMMEYPRMVSGPGKFDTRLMEVCRGKIVSKGGAEGYQQIGIMPGVLAKDSPGIGIALKITDGDSPYRARPSVILEILHLLGAITPEELQQLEEFGPQLPVKNWRNIVVGKAYPLIQFNALEGDR